MYFRLCRVVLLALGVLLLVSWPSYEAFAGDGVQFDGVRGTVGRMGMVSEKQEGALAEGVGARNISEVKLLASERSEEQHFGASVSLSGEWALVGAPKDDDNGVDSGAAYVYRWNGSSWQEEAKLIASDGAERDLFGNAVSLSGEVALVGSSPDYSKSAGAAYIFRFDGSTWQEEAKLTASDGQIGDGFGQSVSVSGSVALVAAPLDENGSSSGSVYIFRKSSDGTSWQEERKLTFEDGAGLDWLGDSVSIDGEVALIGASRSDSVYVYRWDGNEWQLEEKLLANDANTGDYFGRSVSLSGDVALIGAPYNDDLAANAGSAYVFRFDGQSWQQEQTLQLNEESLSNHFGYSVSMSGEMALVGTYAGTAYLYRLGDEGWQEEARLQPSDGGGNLFGESVSLDGEMALVGAAAADDAIAGQEAGSAYLYNLSSGNAPDITLFPGSIRKIANWKDSERLMIANVGTEALSWGVSDSPSWLTASPASGTLAAGERLSVTIDMDATHLALGSYREQLTITTNDPDESSLGVAILLTVMPYQHTLLPDDGPWDKFGHEVSLDGDVAIVGAPSYADMQLPFSPGMAQIYRFDGRTWQLEQQLQASDWALGDRFGYSVEMSGDVAIVGAPGAASSSAYLFRWDGDQWQEEQKLVGSDESRHFASHVDISEDVAFIGAEGAVYVYRFDGSSWQLEQTLSASDENENSFGSAFSGSGNYLLVGAPEEDAHGVAYMYRFDGSSWIEEAKLMGSDAGEGHNFGVSVSLSDNKALIRATNSAYFWHQNGNQWQEEARFAVSGGFSGFQSYNYNSVSLNGNRAVVQSAERFVTIFHWNGSSWVEELHLFPIDRPGMGSFDSSLSLSGSTLLVGDAWQYGTDSAYLYDLSVKVPDITISRSDLSLALAEGTSRRESVTITNNTTETVVLQCTPGCTGNSWLAVTPISSTLPPMASQELLIDIDATTLNREHYRHLLTITSPPLTPPNTRGGTLKSPQYRPIPGEFPVPPPSPPELGGIEGGRGVRGGLVPINLPVSLRVTPPESKLSGSADSPPTSGGDQRADDNQFGQAVSISGDWALVGTTPDSSYSQEPGSAYLYRSNGSNWQPETRFAASDGTSDNGFGRAVSLSDSVAVVGAPFDEENGRNSGAVYVYRQNGDTWQESKLTASDGGDDDYFGISVSISGDLLLVGAPLANANGDDSGAVYAFRWNGESWQEESKLSLSNGSGSGHFGSSVSVSGNAALIAASGESQGDSNGLAYIYRWDGSTWQQEQTLQPTLGGDFGGTVSLSGDVALIGHHTGGDQKQGSAYFFRFNGQTWAEEAVFTGEKWYHEFGYSVVVDGDLAMIGARGDDELESDSGAAYVYRWNGTNWQEQSKIMATNGAESDHFGTSVGLSGQNALIGAPFHDHNGHNSGGAYLYDLSQDSIQLNVSPGTDRILVSFDLVRSLSGQFNHYDLYRSADGGTQKLISSPTNTNYTDTDPELTQGTQYCYHIQAKDNSNTMIGQSNLACTTLASTVIWLPIVISNEN